MSRKNYNPYNETPTKGTIVYVGPKKFVESEFVSRMADKHATVSEDGEVILNPKFKLTCRIVGFAIGASIVVGFNILANRAILNGNENEMLTD